jgi:ankyrin repeat protein
MEPRPKIQTTILGRFCTGRSNGRDTDVVSNLLENGAQTDLRNENEDIALHIAITYKYPNSMVTLIKHGVDIDALDQHGHTALHKATRLWYAEIASLLVKNGATIGRMDDIELSLLDIATEIGNLQTVKLALNHQKVQHLTFEVETAACIRLRSWDMLIWYLCF